jgi:hypothetical protein
VITNNQIKVLDENELAYLYYCCKTEWDSKNIGYQFDWYILKAFRNNSIQHILNKYSSNVKEEYKNIVLDILNKLEQNY